MFDNSSRVIDVDINEILPNRFQPRIQFDEEEILELSDSIKEHGVIQPIVVRTIGDKYEIIAGERRYKASVLAGKETVPVIVKNLNDKDSAEIALIENVQRKNLTPIEEALSYKKILDMGYITQENLANKLGKSQSAVANKIRLLNLSDEVQEALLENKISERHARSLLKLETKELQNKLLNRIITERLTVRRTDEEIEKLKNSNDTDESSDSQKVIEKGEINMNNNMFGMPNIPQNPQPNFDIFGTNNAVQQPVEQPVVNPVPPVEQPTPNFDIFSNGFQAGVTPSIDPIPTMNSVQPTIQEEPVVNPISSTTAVPEVPYVEPTPEVAPMPTMGGMSLDATPNFMQQPAMNTVQPAQEVPTTQPFAMPSFESVQTPQMPTMGGIQFDANGTVISASPVQPEASVEPQMPSIPTMQPVEPQIPTPVEPVIPQTAPIMESPMVENNTEMTQQSENLFSFGDANLNTVEQESILDTPSIPEFKMPEPIIVTDYSKQYDPVMPQTQEFVTPKVDFKEVISAIRECSSKIEQYGFKIDVEEYDLANLYQVIFKIEK